MAESQRVINQLRFLIIDGGNQQLRVRFFNNSKIGFLNPQESEVNSSVLFYSWGSFDQRHLRLICSVKKCKNPFLDSLGFKNQFSNC